MDKSKKEADKIKEQPVTYEVYAAMPDDGQRYEVIEGVLEVMSPSPTFTHQDISMQLTFSFFRHCESDYKILSAPLDVILSNTNVLQPDLILIHRSRLHIVTSRGIEGVPDLVVEILSPGSRKRDKVKKLTVYEKHGVPEYWIIDPQTRVLEQYQMDESGLYRLLNLFEGDERIHSDKLPCVAFSVDDIFRDVIQ